MTPATPTGPQPVLYFFRSSGLLQLGATVLCHGWAGRNVITDGAPQLGLNNPALSNVHNVGPLPAGRYKLTAVDTARGPMTIHLEPLPDPGEDPTKPLAHMYGRAGFLIHGWTAEHPFESSDGCICAGNDARTRAWMGARELLVV